MGEAKMFRSTNDDYLHSGYDRGHLAAAGNHRLSHTAMSQTFILSNIAPQKKVLRFIYAWIFRMNTSRKPHGVQVNIRSISVE
ncbi:unnamed protein product [Trichobilharzia regenti]|nr:unnamed protein product [Trichobilharzia regenti]